MKFERNDILKIEKTYCYTTSVFIYYFKVMLGMWYRTGQADKSERKDKSERSIVKAFLNTKVWYACKNYVYLSWYYIKIFLEIGWEKRLFRFAFPFRVVCPTSTCLFSWKLGFGIFTTNSRRHVFFVRQVPGSTKTGRRHLCPRHSVQKSKSMFGDLCPDTYCKRSDELIVRQIFFIAFRYGVYFSAT